MNNELKRVPLHVQLAETLRGEIALKFTPGDRFLSQNELMERFGVAQNTAREAVSLLIHEQLVQRKFGSGTFVTDKKPDKHIAVLSELDISSPALSSFFRRVTQSVRHSLRSRDVPARLYSGHSIPYAPSAPKSITNDEFFQDLNAGRIMGVVKVATPINISELVPSGQHIPIVDCRGENPRGLVDYYDLIRKGVHIMQEKGCQNVWMLDCSGKSVHERHRDTFISECIKNGLHTDPEWIRCFARKDQLSKAETLFKEMWNESTVKPDGVLVTDDILYRHISPALVYNHIKIPEDLVVVSHANKGDTTPMIPSPIRLEVDPDEGAEYLADLLLAKLYGQAADEKGDYLSITIRDAAPALDLAMAH